MTVHLKRWISTVWFFVWGYRREEVSPELPQKPRKPRGKSKTDDSSLQWRTFGDLLDRLSDHFRYLKSVRSSAPDAYNLYRQVGGYIINTQGGIEIDQKINATWRKGARPAFGMVSALGDNDSKTLTPKLLYFQKHSYSPEGVQPWYGDVYKVGIYYNDKNNQEMTCWCDVWLGVGVDGSLTLLREKGVRYHPLPRRKRENSGSGFYETRWRTPAMLDDIGEKDNSFSRQEKAAGLFSIVFNAVHDASAGLHVRATKGSMSALFCIDMLRTPYFFKDREKTVTVNGKTKRIFHIVRTHKRRLQSREVYVKSHFRGLRKFTWKGYSVIVSMPGKHHKHLIDFTAGAEISEPRPGMADATKTGQILQEAMTR